MFWESGLFIPLRVKCTILFFLLVHHVLISLNNHPLLCFKKTAAAILRMHSILSHLSQRHGMKYFNCFVAYSASLTLIFDGPKKKKRGGGRKYFILKSLLLWCSESKTFTGLHCYSIPVQFSMLMNKNQLLKYRVY